MMRRLAIQRREKLILGKRHKCKGPEAAWPERVSEGEELREMRSGRSIMWAVQAVPRTSSSF